MEMINYMKFIDNLLYVFDSDYSFALLMSVSMTVMPLSDASSIIS